MQEYARLGAQKVADAIALVSAYFTLPRDRFVKAFFAGRKELLEFATTQSPTAASLRICGTQFSNNSSKRGRRGIASFLLVPARERRRLLSIAWRISYASYASLRTALSC